MEDGFLNPAAILRLNFGGVVPYVRICVNLRIREKLLKTSVVVEKMCRVVVLKKKE